MKQIFCFILICFTLLVGCGSKEPSNLGPAPQKVDNISNNQEQTKKIDLNGDGLIDTVSFVYKQEANNYNSLYTLTVNGVSIKGLGDNIDGYFNIVDIDIKDKIKEISVGEAGPSGDYASTFYYYNGKSLVRMGKIPASFMNDIKINGDGKIVASTRAQVLQTWCYYATYTLSNNHALTRVPQKFYETNYKVKVIKSLKLQKAPSNNETAFILRPGEEVNLIGTDDTEWCLVQNNKGQKGWFAVEKFSRIKGTNKEAAEFFEGLSYAD